ncbi:MAG: hypothetical protein ABI718_13770 [Acidobacteriota bacterium]
MSEKHEAEECVLDLEACGEIVSELVSEQGTAVFENRCSDYDSMASSIGTFVYKFRDLYWIWDDDMGVFGPYETLDKALLQGGGVNWVTETVDEISSSELDEHEIARLLHVEVEPGFNFKINGQGWYVTRSGKLRQKSAAPSSKRASRVTRSVRSK